jgi:hypothetical protein
VITFLVGKYVAYTPYTVVALLLYGITFFQALMAGPFEGSFGWRVLQFSCLGLLGLWSGLQLRQLAYASLEKEADKEML